MQHQFFLTVLEISSSRGLFPKLWAANSEETICSSSIFILDLCK